MGDASDGRTTIPPVCLEPADLHILRFLRERGPTYHINISKAIPHDIRYVSRRCKYLARHDALDRRSTTYYALTERGEELLEEASTEGIEGGTTTGSGDDQAATGG
jgi:DNA-binding MarR family transcriptional regulator